jgi:hypothetical protein
MKVFFSTTEKLPGNRKGTTNNLLPKKISLKISVYADFQFQMRLPRLFGG